MFGNMSREFTTCPENEMIRDSGGDPMIKARSGTLFLHYWKVKKIMVKLYVQRFIEISFLIGWQYN